MRLLANEKFPGLAITAIRLRGHDVVWIREDSPGISDHAVLSRATIEGRILITFDKDFGELVFRLRLNAPSGIILFRIPPDSPSLVAQTAVTVLESRTDWSGHFSIVEKNRVRMPLSSRRTELYRSPVRLTWIYIVRSAKWYIDTFSIVTIGAGLALVGIVTTLWLEMGQPSEMMQQGQMRGGIGRGEIYAITGTFLLVLGAELGRKQLQSIPLGVFSVFRNFIGSIIFLIVVLIMLGPGHFMDLFRPVLWGWMVLYGSVIVVCGQLCWFSGIKRVTPADISLASAFSPIAGVIFAYLILGEIPMTAQIIGGTVILCGIGVGLAGDLKFPHREEKRTRSIKSEDKPKAFTGV